MFKQHKRIKFITSIVLVLFIVTGCASNKEDRIHVPEEQWKTGAGTLDDHIGNQQSDSSEKLLPFSFDNEDLYKKTEYTPPTGKWFLHNGSGKFGYVQTRDTKSAGSEYVFSLISHDKDGEKFNKDIRIQLTKRDHTYKILEMINEKVIHVNRVNNVEEIFKNQLPMEENVSYIFSAEILDEHGTVEDTMITQIYVPKVEMNVNLKLDQTTFNKSDQQAILKIENLGPTILSLGTYYTIEKKIDDVWKIVPLDYVFTDIAIFINPDNTYEQRIDIEQLSPDNYRITKDIGASGTQINQTLAVTFQVE